MEDFGALFKKIEDIKKKYEDHFEKTFPEKIIGWWDAWNPETYNEGVAEMEKDVNEAIRKNEPIEEMSDEIWDKIIF